MNETERLESKLRAMLLQAMADADQVSFQYNQEENKTMTLINAGRILAFEQVMAWALDECEGISENARLHNEACDSEKFKDNSTAESNLPYIRKQIVTEVRLYNPVFGDDKICKCGHSYYRHFDGYEEPDDMDVGCKYCDCWTFIENNN